MSHAKADELSRRLRRKHEVAHRVVTPNVFPHQSCNQTRRRRGESKASEGQFSWTAVEIAQVQRSDPDNSPVIARIKEGKPKPSHDKLSCLNPISRAIWAQRELLELKDEIFRIQPRGKSKNFKPRVPETLVRPALQRLHDGQKGSHLGQLKTLR